MKPNQPYLRTILDKHIYYATHSDKFNGLSTAQAEQAILQWALSCLPENTELPGRLPITLSGQSRYNYDKTKNSIIDQIRDTLKESIGDEK